MGEGTTGWPLKDRAAVERFEREQLAPYAMCSADSRGRDHEELEAGYRTCFQRDRDRILHSTAFRRLEYKTQVFVNHEGDHYRTRLTHTLEVAQISRSIARVLGLNEDLVEAASLAHDLGHPPFGHAGEDSLDELMSEHGGFNHNVQSLRVVERLERKYPDFHGLNLTWEVRESIVKHGGSIQLGDAPDPERVRAWDPDTRPLLEAQLSDVADSLAYTNHDIDDGLRSGFITREDLREVRLWRDAEEAVLGVGGRSSEKTFVARMVSFLIDLQVRDLVRTTRESLEAHGIDSAQAVRDHPSSLVRFSSEMSEKKSEMEEFLMGRLYRHYRTLRMQEKAKRFIRDIFNEYRRCPRQLPPSFREAAEGLSVERAICDWIAGMTDRYCQDEYQRLFHPYERI